jgi:hypothetical protein
MHERQQRHWRRRRNDERRRRIKQKDECAYYLHAVHDIVIDDIGTITYSSDDKYNMWIFKTYHRYPFQDHTTHLNLSHTPI